MKKTAIAIVALAALLSGCNGLDRAIEAYKVSHPDTKDMAIYDDDGDHIADAWGADTNNDGLPDVEIEGTREYLASLEETDMATADLLAIIGACGVPFAAVAGKFWGRMKPLKKLATTQTHFKGVVQSVQAMKAGKTITPGDWRKIAALLREAQKTVPGLQDAILEAKNELAAKNTEDAAATE